MADAEAGDQDLIDESFRRHLRQRVVERQDHRQVEPEALEQLQLSGPGCQREVRDVGAEEHAWVRLEHHHAGRRVAGGGGVAGRLQQCLMAAMDAVEVADGDDAAAIAGRRRAAAVENANLGYGMI